MVNIKAVVFDAFGTLVQINHRRSKPYAQLLRWLNQLGRPYEAGDSRAIMTRAMGIVGAAKHFGLHLYARDRDPSHIIDMLSTFESDLTDELMGIQLFPESVDVMLTLKDLGVKVGICSNLAQPYAIPVKALLPFELDSYSWSFDVGYLKPDYQMYQHACDALQLPPEEILFVGDTVDADVTGPCKFGMRSLQVNRGENGNDLYDVVDLVRKHLKWKQSTTPE